MKKELALIIHNHTLCNLQCMHCQGTAAERLPIVVGAPLSLPDLITLRELIIITEDLLQKGYIGPGKITHIRFGGDWSEPTLDSSLAEKVKFLLEIA